ncbi:MAG: manganese-dependent inorganic pyrophosphatase [Furfurilactobacillus sp.]|jgi:manganese-dependent inorganic pyrophosphatase|uniref:Probable manganese-dependent inorganic pyrophosphatase n=3 Tax=Furfurilactobacillus TaxID=2767882 RepID=A0A0R1RSY7_9LACO|nr:MULTISPECIES: manganese-dependent inorganic pyrophosphatase [Furfurilactobacillus]KRL57218.1 manganese-dependent inorganic pyrophosphatase [Furfurilactobacillus rossiae DSM 15814]MCF6160010.1 manganese-dependent inorganic pyrophosphatase [Furfurilactobacillus milii]MCF6162441.1 manganese-dependent inorganic pyrophosphatase [Furfurilactobacillus milii]MCF6165029.1 manganese-dependent inorganic pyrophosphatase [Furfurilactobacillus rossiae]MCF6419961.1 manganese-dependent inorganic pyrophosph
MSKELVFGHQSPDTDAIVAAKAYSYLQNKLGYDTEAVALGEPNEETQFVLNYFDEPTPRVITKASDEVDSVMLVDHNEHQQSVSDIEDVTVTHVVDHHRIANFSTSSPLFYRAEPVGCTSTILMKMFDEYKIEIPAQLAGLMLSAIISDTLLLKSPTTTDDDKAAVIALAEIADVDYKTYGLEELKAGTNLSSKSEAELIEQDAKSFEMGGKNIRIDQINTVDLDEVFARQDKLEAAMAADAKEKGYDLFLVLVTNILDSDSRLLVWGEPTDVVEKAFNTTLTNNTASLPGVVSRKKQVVPPLQDQFK